jgi:hypothetical protein
MNAIVYDRDLYFFWIMDHIVLEFSLSDHPDIERNILGIFIGIGVRFSQMHTPRILKW